MSSARFVRSIRANRKLVMAAASAASLFAISTLSSAQTSGSWTFDGNASWSDATKWSPAVPGNGGVATFVATDTFLVNAPHTITMDLANVALDKFVFNTPYTYS